jgi:hypothetical protein
MAAIAPVAQEPTPVEIANWQAGRSNARQAYQSQLATSNYQRQQAGLANQIYNRQAQFGNQQERQNFDDPYIGRGIFNSGIRQQGLLNMYTNQANQAATAQQQYLAQLGGYGVQDQNALAGQNTSLANIDAQELARRTQLASEIKGII